MSPFVVDASTVLTWCFPDEHSEQAERISNFFKRNQTKAGSDERLKAAFKTNSVEFLRREKLKNSVNEALLSNADENLNFMSKIETDPAFGKFFMSEMFKWYSQSVSPPK